MVNHQAIVMVEDQGNYHDLYQWSVESYADFWAEFWTFSGIVSSRMYDEVVDPSKGVEDVPEWFAGSRLNYAENLLRHPENDKVALYVAREGREEIVKVTFEELRQQVALFAAAMRKMGVRKGDRVGVLDRFSQIQPKLIFSVEAVVYNGKVHGHLDKLQQVASGLPDLEKVVVIPYVAPREEVDVSKVPGSAWSPFSDSESISRCPGGTDIISCFMGQNVSLPVYKGEIQARNLGMAVEAWDEAVHSASGGGAGTSAAVCPGLFVRSACFLQALDASAAAGVWAHGDYCKINPKTGGIIMLGRSDGTLNPNGVRFGSSEIYNIGRRALSGGSSSPREGGCPAGSPRSASPRPPLRPHASRRELGTDERVLPGCTSSPFLQLPGRQEGALWGVPGPAAPPSLPCSW
ncbi:PREDICTED: acetoacetyl-CoA synthetase [Myotis davidii]|uniref:acetoacetyl-CoA synthetase n=1 Tax=Myotis davidii TaxID=225400 RepID=UPI0007672BB3|nr:PREDICTED: acetoacetyl-CoA synthetase [Myotis davidii]